MTQALLRPEVALKVTLRARLADNTDCIFAVAYLGAVAVSQLEDVIKERLSRSRFSLRVVFRASDLQTEPAAIDALLALRTGTKGRLDLRWSQLEKFHAKAFGFRASRAARPLVVVGSANLTEGAIGADSGELGVLLSDSAIADEAWDVLEDFWETAKPVTKRWLEAYRKAYQTRKAKEKAAVAEVRKWSRKMPTIRRSLPLPDLSKQALFLEQFVPATPDEVAEVERAQKDSDNEIANDWVRSDSREDAYATPLHRNILTLEWFAADDDSKGVRYASVARLTKRPIRVIDPKTKKAFWLLFFTPVRGSRLVLRQRDRARSESRLRKHGLSWSTLSSMAGYLRGRRGPLLKALRTLGMKIK